MRLFLTISAKVAIVDAIAREGLLPINPYYASGGETIPLIYYYTWHFLASQLKLLAGVTGWQAEVAFNWFTGLATLGFLCALAIHLGFCWSHNLFKVHFGITLLVGEPC